MVVWCPDWPVIAAEIVAGVPASTPVAVLHANRVLACSPAARAEGVRRGLRRRDAQGRCPGLTIVDHDPSRDAVAYEPVVAAIGDLVAGVEVLRPGVCAVVARGPARFFGGEEAAAERMVEHVAQCCDVEAQIGIADGVFAAGLAARAGRVVPAGQTPAFLAGLDVAVLDRPELASLLHRMGIRTIAEFVALPAVDVLGRFGPDAALAHRVAGGRDDRRLVPRVPPVDLSVTETFDEPLARVDVAAFAARSLAERLHDGLVRHGVACTRLAIEAYTAAGEELHRTWRHDGLLSAAALADRVRWQLDGWLSPNRGPAVTPTAGVALLRLTPEGVVPHLGLQQGLWGEVGEERDRAHRVLTRVQGLLGPEAVLVAVLGGGRGQADLARLVTFGDERPMANEATLPWPGRLPAPSPATVYRTPQPATVVGTDGAPVGVTGRLAVTGIPASVAVAGSAAVGVTGWAGPWPVDERWWAGEDANRYARFQMTLADGRALSMVLTTGRWEVEACYD
jgi:protein ImuB